MVEQRRFGDGRRVQRRVRPGHELHAVGDQPRPVGPGVERPVVEAWVHGDVDLALPTAGDGYDGRYVRRLVVMLGERDLDAPDDRSLPAQEGQQGVRIAA